jgi:hypothetical protein
MTPNEWPIRRAQTWYRARLHLTSLLALPNPPLWVGIIVAAVLIVVETVLVQQLGRVGPRAASNATCMMELNNDLSLWHCEFDLFRPHCQWGATSTSR